MQRDRGATCEQLGFRQWTVWVRHFITWTDQTFFYLNYHIHGYAGALQSGTLLQQTVTLSFDGVDHCACVIFHPSFLWLHAVISYLSVCAYFMRFSWPISADSVSVLHSAETDGPYLWFSLFPFCITSQMTCCDGCYHWALIILLIETW